MDINDNRCDDDGNFRTCSKCKERKHITDFCKTKQRKSGISSWCRACKNTSTGIWQKEHNPESHRISSSKYFYKDQEIHLKTCAEYRKNNPEKRNYTARSSYLRRKYGLSLEQYRAMEANQENACAICKTAFIECDKLYVDHNHETLEIRGLLCRSCNFAIGALKDSPQHLMNAVAYLTTPPATKYNLKAKPTRVRTNKKRTTKL